MIIILCTISMNDVKRNLAMNVKRMHLVFWLQFVDKLIVIFKRCKFKRIVVMFETNIH
jgi:hypothetical protein